MTRTIIDLSVDEWLRSHQRMPVQVAAGDDLEYVARQMLASRTRDAYVVTQQRVHGHLGFNQVVNYLFTQERPIHTHRQLFARVAVPTAGEVMDPHYPYCRPDEALCDVLHRQLASAIDDLLVLAADDTLLGVIRLEELVLESLG